MTKEVQDRIEKAPNPWLPKVMAISPPPGQRYTPRRAGLSRCTPFPDEVLGR